jgi:hypothetical protein
MNQQQIFENMTKGERWSNDASFVLVENDGDAEELFQNIQGQRSSSIERVANAAACAIAVESTWNKGINPEYINRWQYLLQDIVARCELDGEITIIKGDFNYSAIKEQLDKAKLK